MTGEPDTPARPMGRGPRVLLVASLALNLLIVGAVGGAVIGHFRHDRHRPVVRDLGFGPYAHALTPEDRREMRRSFIRETGGFRAMRQEAETQAAHLLALLRADSFDDGAFEALMHRQEERAAGRLRIGQALLTQRIEAMTPAERRAFADRLEAALARRDDRHDHRPPAPPPPSPPSPAAPPSGGD